MPASAMPLAYLFVYGRCWPLKGLPLMLAVCCPKLCSVHITIGHEEGLPSLKGLPYPPCPYNEYFSSLVYSSGYGCSDIAQLHTSLTFMDYSKTRCFPMYSSELSGTLVSKPLPTCTSAFPTAHLLQRDASCLALNTLIVSTVLIFCSASA